MLGPRWGGVGMQGSLSGRLAGQSRHAARTAEEDVSSGAHCPACCPGRAAPNFGWPLGWVISDTHGAGMKHLSWGRPGWAGVQA